MNHPISTRIRRTVLLTCLLPFLSAPSFAQKDVTEELSLGGGKLTAFGAERAGNADGSIPAYNGGITPADAPASFRAGSGRFPNPFADETPLYVIDSKNMAQYDALLNPGTKAKLQAHPSYKLKVFKSHRTMGYPQWVLQNSIKNAKTAKLLPNGDGVQGAYGGIPFPQPKDGHEVMWNSALRYTGGRVDYHAQSFFIDSNGQKTLAGDQEAEFHVPYYDPKADQLKDKHFQTLLVTAYAPISIVGEMYLIKYSIDHNDKADATWAYSTGIRRIRLVPELKYDTPTPLLSGAILADEVNAFSGRMDRFNFKLVGKKEMLIPYNSYEAMFRDDLVGPQHENVDLMRWEKHRVWVVDATLKPGQQHIYSRRTFYIDEDSWTIVLYEAYDSAGKLRRTSANMNFTPYDSPRAGLIGQVVHDFKERNYAVIALMGARNTYQKYSENLRPGSRYTPDAVAGRGIR
jgi:hypothetical protein